MNEPESRDDLAQADDRVIAVAFRYSLIALLSIVLLAALIYGVSKFRDQRAPEPADAPRADLQRLLRDEAGPAPPTAGYRDIATESGIDFVHLNGATGERLLPETMGGGVAVFDYDGDGYPDLLFVNSGHWPDSDAPAVDTLRLYRNDGSGRFDEVTVEVGLAGDHGYGMGVAVGDVDGDGRDDVLLTAVGRNRLFLNRTDGFVDGTAEAGVAGGEGTWSSSAGFFDADGDGDLDLFVVNYVEWSRATDYDVDYRLTGIGRAYGPPTNFAGTQPYYYVNDGSGRFVERGREAGLHVLNPATGAAVGKALALIPVDLDNDGDLDLVVANDTVRNFAFINDGNGIFEEQGTLLGLGYDRNGHATGAMGIDAAEVDGALAIGIGNFANEMSSLYLGRGGAFADEAIGRGIGAPSRAVLTFGLLFYDYDLDGRPDFLQANGHVEDEINTVQSSQTHSQSAQLFWNCGTGCAQTFIQVSMEDIGDLARPVVGRGAAYGDIDGDGQLEILITQIGGAPLLLKAQEAAGNWLRIALDGAPGNPHGIGGAIEIEYGGAVQRQSIMPTRSYLSQVEPVATFGLGKAAAAGRVTVTWPDGLRQEIGALEAGRLHRIRRP